MLPIAANLFDEVRFTAEAECGRQSKGDRFGYSDLSPGSLTQATLCT